MTRGNQREIDRKRAQNRNEVKDKKTGAEVKTKKEK